MLRSIGVKCMPDGKLYIFCVFSRNFQSDCHGDDSSKPLFRLRDDDTETKILSYFPFFFLKK